MKRKNRTKNTKFKLKKEMGDKCVYCGCTHKFLLTLDHKTPLNRGGEDTVKNLQTTCNFCNQLKGNMTHLEFKKYLRILKELKDFSKIRVTIGTVNFVFRPFANVSHGIMEEKRRV